MIFGLLSILTSQDHAIGNASSLEIAWVFGMIVAFGTCLWGDWDTWLDLRFRLDKNRELQEKGIPLLPIEKAATVNAWRNVRNAVVWTIKALAYEAVGVFAATRPPAVIPAASPANAVVPFIFLTLGGLLIFQVVAERRDRIRTWNILGRQVGTQREH